MWEFEIISDSGGNELINYISNFIAEDLKSASGVMAIGKNEEISLCIGCREEVAPKILAMLKLALCDVFCEKMKEAFLNENINFENKSMYSEAFIKACTYFDLDLEKHLVLRCLKFDKKIHLQGFFNFKLQGLKEKWQELCKITNTNYALFLNSENFLELLKFLLKNIESKCHSVILEMQDECIIYHDKSMDFDVISHIDLNNCTEILSKLIDLNPNLIKIKNAKPNSETIKVLKSIFEDKIILG